MVGGEMKARMNQVTPARQATTGTITAMTEIHRRAGLPLQDQIAFELHVRPRLRTAAGMAG